MKSSAVMCNMMIDGRETQTVLLPFERNESEGTVKYFQLAYPIIDALDNGKRLVIDEIDSKMHPKLTSKNHRVVQFEGNQSASCPADIHHPRHKYPECQNIAERPSMVYTERHMVLPNCILLQTTK